MHNLYETLELHKGASAQDIKRAYHRLAHQFHPDKNPGDKVAEERFKEACRAYNILSDAKRRSRYDRFGPAGVGLGGEGGFSGADFAQSVSESVGDLFQEIFGRHRAPPSPAEHKTKGARTLPLRIDFVTAVLGGHAPLPLVRHELCVPCQGSGAHHEAATQTCHACHGTGSLRVKQGIFSIGKRCPDCAGQGRMRREPCAHCQGRGHTERNATLKVRIPKGARSGTLLRLKGEGAPMPSGALGDLLITLEVTAHPRFTQHNADLSCNWPITIVEAALGAQLQLPFVDGTPIPVTVPVASQYGDIVRVKHAGAYHPNTAQRGDLLVTLQVEVPCALGPEAQSHLEALRALDFERHYPKRTVAASNGPDRR